ncbi:MAG TPA: site-specific tyrosine recombinase XerD [Salinivirgaceae bacterium]|nr:site-specific tyrosine recombinase XerD [Salinivirgaceae bacterium]
MLDVYRYRKEFLLFLKLDKGLSGNSVEAYDSDVQKLHAFLADRNQNYNLNEITTQQLLDFLMLLSEFGLSATSQARILSGIKAYFKFLNYSERLQNNPAELLETPRLKRKLPVVLTVEEINRMVASIDLSSETGQRNRAIIELLYGSGLRVSELVNLTVSGINFEFEFVRVLGKGNKERLVPMSSESIKQVRLYIDNYRNRLKINRGDEDIVFLNRRGRRLTRNMIFILIRQLAKNAGITKTISPHTFRHTFATHLIENGADLRVVQEMLGHRSILTTEIYTHIDTTFLRQSIVEFHPWGKGPR